MKDESGKALTIGDVATNESNIFYDEFAISDEQLYINKQI